MKPLALTLIAVISASLLPDSALAQEPVRPAARLQQEVMQLVQAHYVREFQKQIEPTDEQWADLQPLIQTFLRNRFQNAQRKERALAALENAPEGEIDALNKEIDQATQQAIRMDNQFMGKVDPILTAIQRGKLRQLQNNIWPRLQQTINQAREQAQRDQPLERPNLRGQRDALRENQGARQTKRAVR